MRVNWKKKYEIYCKLYKSTKKILLEYKKKFQTAHQLVNGLQKQIDEAKRSSSALKGQITKLRKRSTEALELVELLEWARNKELEVNINRIFTTVFQALSNKKADVLARKDSPIESLRAAKKAVEVGK